MTRDENDEIYGKSDCGPVNTLQVQDGECHIFAIFFRQMCSPLTEFVYLTKISDEFWQPGLSEVFVICNTIQQ